MLASDPDAAEATELARTVAMTATPSAEPSWRTVDCVAEPWPDLSVGTSTRTVPVSWAEAMPSPTP